MKNATEPKKRPVRATTVTRMLQRGWSWALISPKRTLFRVIDWKLGRPIVVRQ